MLRSSGGHCGWWSPGSLWFNGRNSGLSKPPEVASIIRSDLTLFIHMGSGSLFLLRLSEQRKLWVQTSLRQQLHPTEGKLTFFWIFTEPYERCKILWVKPYFSDQKKVKILIIFNSRCPHQTETVSWDYFLWSSWSFFQVIFLNLPWDKEIYDVTVTKL